MSAQATDRVGVAIAVLWQDGKVLVRRRRPDEPLPDLWEFPGGKIGSGEDPEAAARREVREEMGFDPGPLALREMIEHDYPDRPVRLVVLEGAWRGEPSPPDGAEWAWLAPEELARRSVPEANRGLIARLREGALP